MESTNIFYIPELVANIISNLPTEELMSIRRTSPIINQETMRVARKNVTVSLIDLHEDELQNFLDLMSNTLSPYFDGLDINVDNVNQIVTSNTAENIMLRRVSESIRRLEIVHSASVLSLESFVELLLLFSSLIEIKLAAFPIVDQGLLPQMNALTNVKYLKLTKTNDNNISETIITQLVQQMTKLIKLTIKEEDDNLGQFQRNIMNALENSHRFENIKKMKLATVTKRSLRKITNFTQQGMQLEELDLEISHVGPNSDSQDNSSFNVKPSNIRNLLAALGPHLKKLSFEMSPDAVAVGSNVFVIEIPVMAKLKSLILSSETIPMFTRQSNFKTKLPKLESLIIKMPNSRASRRLLTIGFTGQDPVDSVQYLELPVAVNNVDFYHNIGQTFIAVQHLTCHIIPNDQFIATILQCWPHLKSLHLKHEIDGEPTALLDAQLLGIELEEQEILQDMLNFGFPDNWHINKVAVGIDDFTEIEKLTLEGIGMSNTMAYFGVARMALLTKVLLINAALGEEISDEAKIYLTARGICIEEE